MWRTPTPQNLPEPRPAPPPRDPEAAGRDVMQHFRRLEGRAWMMGDDYSIADISLLGWVNNLITFYEARELVDFDTLDHVPGWLARGLARPAVQRGLKIPSRES